MSGFKIYVLGALTLGTLSNVWAASPAIGVATAKGSFAVNQMQVSGSATLFDGSQVRTGIASSRVEMSNGSRIDLNANSTLTVHGSEAVLEKGSSELGTSEGFNLQARTLRIETEGTAAKAEVRLNGERNVLVKALNSPVRVYSKTGVLVAKVNPGMGVTLDPYAAPPDDFDMSGCLLKQSPGSLFGLAVDSQLYQLTGANLDANVGNRVHVTGTRGSAAAALKGASALVAVTKIEMTDVGGCLAAASRFPGLSGTGGKTIAAAHASHTTAYIIAGVAVAGAGGGIAAAVSGGNKSH